MHASAERSSNSPIATSTFLSCASEIRSSFLSYFRSKGHEIVPSSPVVLPTDPTLLFANAGMNQFKDIFLGTRETSYTRVANTQKCIRVSGKHNDLEEVGLDTYHHTFFEMLGNWSFGDYYKKEAIAWAWELMTKVWGLPKKRLWVTVYRDDDEAFELWKTCTNIAHDQILRFDEKDNFWEMGEVGPCGPCSEIHMDLSASGCRPQDVNAGIPEVVEIWNLVFIQYNRLIDGTLEDLPAKHVDTGMGLERVVAVLEGVTSNYDTDLFQPLIRKLEEASKSAYHGETAVAMRVISDHIRALTMAISDGVMPSNEGRGYVLRRLLRRAVRYGRKLGLTQPFLHQLVPVVEEIMGSVFPEIQRHRTEVMRVVEYEEEHFASTLSRGMVLFDEVSENLSMRKETCFPGEEAFKLYDTYGFPLDLTQLMAQEKGLSVDEDGFHRLMRVQKEQARAARKSAFSQGELEELSERMGKDGRSTFIGYDQEAGESIVLGLWSQGKNTARLNAQDEGILLLEPSPFYAEAGGQLGDHGLVEGPCGMFEVIDTQRSGTGLIFHMGRVLQGTMQKDERVKAGIDVERRRNLARHHTGTHLLNAALRELVNPKTKQAGSLVAADRLRFDFTHAQALSDRELEAIERRVQGWILDNVLVSSYSIPFKEVSGSGIIAVFNEKYGDTVRVVDIGGFSKELCGGIHVQQTGELGLFRIVSESSVSAGIRRIEASCGWSAYELMQGDVKLLSSLSQQFSVHKGELSKRVEALIEQNKTLMKMLKTKAKQEASGLVEELEKKVKKIDKTHLIAEVVAGQSLENLRSIMDRLRPRLPSGVIVLGSSIDGKAQFMSSVSKDLVDQGLHAGNLIKEIARVAGGGGGGPAHKAQAGAKDGNKVHEAISKVEEVLLGMQ